jgi:hypothetical protein
MVYFCSSCRARFSGYQEEPMFEGIPIFSEMAYYSFRDAMESGDTFTRGELLDSYRTILEENPPVPNEASIPDCDLCSRDLLMNCDHVDLCWLPSV